MQGLLVAAALAAALWLLLALAGPWLVRRGFRVPRRPERRDPGRFRLRFETVHIPTVCGKRLFGWFIPAGGRPGPAVAVLHGWGGNAEFMLPLAPALHEAGFSVLLFDARCHGGSDDDDFASMPRFAEDLEHAVAWLEARPEVVPGRIAAIGHSVGAAACLLAASRSERLAAVVSLASFAHPAEVMRQMMREKRIPYRPIGWWVLRHVERAIGFRYEAIAPRNTVGRARCPVLLVHGDADRTVPVEDAYDLYRRRRDDRTRLMIVPGADHFAVDKVRARAGEIVGFLAGAVGSEDPPQGR